MISNETVDLLNKKVEQFNQPSFIEFDPISVPHLFTKKQDIEISGLFAAIFAWGQRKTIISKAKELMELMENSPFDFILNATENDLKSLQYFKHRTFNFTDLLCFVDFLKNHYSHFESLENAFNIIPKAQIKENLIAFVNYFFSNEEYPQRTRKHLSNPAKNATCKRLNMYLRWMVRQDNNGVDFGLWKNISTANLIIPCDVHVDRTARILKLCNTTKVNWTMAEEITNNLRLIDPIDPVKYDFALFGLGIEKYFENYTN